MLVGSPTKERFGTDMLIRNFTGRAVKIDPPETVSLS